MPQISRVIRTKQEARSAYSKLSRWYDLMVGDFEHKPRNAAIQQLAPGIGKSILEIGCGTGQAIVKIAELVGPLLQFRFPETILCIIQTRM